ncbi:LysM peptidoglycan-binding domain-containing protein [Paenibacillus sp. J22TS3]|uniref:LysM peptidoglycan-binding domain-containing protein n=1 Tax=Paenibacillus sp. J22TS3 TaxID=2807192 RepID=UPI001B025E2C|nr:LysM peptidoglycan-binding domain-containing protein [Paenibacillus sp. J22TS3]GIP22424.1 stage VI sporulation protein D [Paenibacillus sp. J22TS3]
MTDQSYGLRFDIYERVHLAEETAGIQELVELEILPKIQVIPGNEYAALRGHLHVTGLYRGEGETQELSHLIPVEITIPLSRVNRLEDITVEIENFDVDVLGTHSLNITGVLSLRGIETVAFVSGAGAWSDEEYTAHHEAGREEQETFAEQEPGQSEPSVPVFSEPAAETYWSLPEIQEQTPVEPVSVQEKEAFTASVDSEWADKESEGNVTQAKDIVWNVEQPQAKDIAWNVEQPRTQESLAGERISSKVESADEPVAAKQDAEEPAAQPVAAKSVSAKPNDEESAAEPAAVWQFEQPASAPAAPEEGDRIYTAEEYLDQVQEPTSGEAVPADAEIQAPVEEKPELKIALGSKKTPQVDVQESVPLSSLLQSSRPPKEAEVVEEPQQDTGTEYKEDREDVRWKSLFISNVQDQTPFRQVKLVIVQREETIDVIADRYQINPRELLLYNRLSEQSLEEGQILYIP